MPDVCDLLGKTGRKRTNKWLRREQNSVEKDTNPVDRAGEFLTSQEGIEELRTHRIFRRRKGEKKNRGQAI